MQITQRFDSPVDHSGIGPDDPCGSFPTWNILWFWDFSINSSHQESFEAPNPSYHLSGIGQEHKKPGIVKIQEFSWDCLGKEGMELVRLEIPG